ncbi:MAG TPA: hypothetical protein PLL06_13360 [Acidobacteriota bacterium]|nr:hypothetical protein [Acidobacteriota bacterium]HND21834.1 hypothetical protein [Acidobacteriota bacterium]
MSSDYVRPSLRSPMCEALFKAIRLSLESDRTKMYTNLVLYTSFGVVHGRVKRDDNIGTNDSRIENMIKTRAENDVLELENVEIEHLSSHLATKHYTKFYLRTEDINGFAFEISPQQFTVNL